MTAHDLERFRSVPAADIFKGGRLAARLRRVDEGVEFAYLPGYLDDGAAPVATTLPLSERPVVTAAGAVPPFFAGLLPEGRRLTSLQRAVKTSADDELSLLLAVGGDTIGDVSVLPAGEEPAEVEPIVQVSDDWSGIDFVDLFAEAGVVDAVALPGVQEKVSARMLSVPVSRAAERHILKLDPPEFPHVVENEMFFLHLAADAGLAVAHANIVHDTAGRSGLLVRRFDRVEFAGQLTALACEDAAQVLGRWPADKYKVTAEQVIDGLARRCPAGIVARRDLYRQVCFSWITGNGDLHAKNLSILSTPEGEWRVSPAYDLPATVPYGDRSLALSIGGKTRGVARRRLIEFGMTIGLREPLVTSELDALLDAAHDLPDRIADGALPYSTNITIDFAKELRYRRRQLLG